MEHRQAEQSQAQIAHSGHHAGTRATDHGAEKQSWHLPGDRQGEKDRLGCRQEQRGRHQATDEDGQQTCQGTTPGGESPHITHSARPILLDNADPAQFR